MTRADNSEHLRRAAAARHDAALRRARSVIDQLAHEDPNAITFTSVARAASVSRGWLYLQTDLRAAVIALRARHIDHPPTTTPAAQRATDDSIRQRLHDAHTEIKRLRADNTAIREQLARNLGEQRQHR